MFDKGNVDTLALDLEGTLILNAANPVPRPGLFEFLEFCRCRFARLLIFSAVDEKRFRDIARDLASAGAAPAWFADLDFCYWDYASMRYKDLRMIKGATLERTGIIDDAWQAIDPGQRKNWIAIKPFETTESGSIDDAELARLMDVLDRLAGRGKREAAADSSG